jgi:hypothetical protein
MAQLKEGLDRRGWRESCLALKEQDISRYKVHHEVQQQREQKGER